MDCSGVQSGLSAYLDGQLDETESSLVRGHLAACESCRTEAEQLSTLHADLVEYGTAARKQAGRAADRVLGEFASPTMEPSVSAIPVVSRSPGRSRQWWGHLASAAAGFLLALAIFRGPQAGRREIALAPSPGDTAAQANVADASSAQAVAIPAARLVKATGPISVRTPGEEEWVSLTPPQLSVFTCPTDASVRTDPGVVCELETSTGGVVRMNESCEIRVRSDDELELVRGQVWCRASGSSDLKVVNAEPHPAQQSAIGPWMLTCPTNTESFASCSPSEPLQVVAASGNVDVRTNGTDQTLPIGTFYSVSDGEVKVWESSHGVLTAERWMQPLLTLSGHGNPELNRRVDALLAQVGRTKLSHLFEQDLRSLGEYGALPLLKFTVAEESVHEPHRRQMAMNILADTGPVWMTPDFIGLLEDDDPVVRVAAARGLARLTGETHGYDDEYWKGDGSQLADALAVWRLWWQTNRPNWPVPPPTTWNITPQ